MAVGHEMDQQGQSEPNKRQLEIAGKLIDDFFPDITGNHSSRHYLGLFLQNAVELPPETREALTAVVKSRLNGTSAEVLDGRYEKKDMLPGQFVNLTLRNPKTAVQRPH